MNQNLNNAISLNDWMVISVKGGIVLKYEDGVNAKLVEISRDHTPSVLSLERELPPNFSEKDAWLVARVVIVMLQDEGANPWDGDSLLIPISFYGFEIADLRSLAALAYSCHTKKRTMKVNNKGLIYRVFFDGDCWIISVTNDYKLEFIQNE